MKTYKFAHLADVHWRGLSRHKEYNAVFKKMYDILVSEKVDGIFIVGDIVHSKTMGISPELINCLSNWFRSLGDIAPTYITLGNHDGLILNKDREDTISPIIRALDHPNLTLIKKTDQLKIHDKFLITNFSCFDEENWGTVYPNSEYINIALFHGCISSSQVESEWSLESDVNLSFFNDYDFALLGDIHLHQYLDPAKRIAYCGSTIQQNFGESIDKGFMIWEIESSDKYDSRFISIPNKTPFVTIDWKGSIQNTIDEAENYPDYARFRIRTTEHISQGDIKTLYANLKSYKNATEIVIKDEIPKPEVILDTSRITKRANFRDVNVIVDLIKDYYKPAGMGPRNVRLLEEGIKSLWKNVTKIETTKNGKWSLKSIKFDNTFGYGKNNKVNFDNLAGITGIFGKNRTGKSSICGTIMYGLFNTSDRGSMGNLHVINTRKGYCRADVVFSQKGKLYRVERQSIKKENRAQQVSAMTHLNLYEIDSFGNIVKDLCGEQRRETEKVLRDLIGTAEDFLITSFAAQGEMNSFLKEKATSRKKTLTKFLDLDIFDQINESAKSKSLEVKTKLKVFSPKDYNIVLLDLRNKYETQMSMRKEYYSTLDDTRDRIRNIEIAIASKGSDIVTQYDVSLQEKKIKELQKRKKDIEDKLSSSEKVIESLRGRIEKIQDIKDNFPIIDLKKRIEEKTDFEDNSIKIKHSLDKEKNVLKVLNEKIDVLSRVPCGNKFPDCEFIVNANAANKKIEKQSQKVEEVKEELKEISKTLKILKEEKLDEKYEKYNGLLIELGELSLEKNKLEILHINNENSLGQLNESIRKEVASLDKMKINVTNDSNAKDLTEIKIKLRELKSQEATLDAQVAKSSETLGFLKLEIEKTDKEKKQYDDLNTQWTIFRLIADATSKNGIPLEIIRTRLPEINAEIKSILQPVTGFTVELESEDGSNEMNIYVNYGDSRRIIECCSGMEKMMASLAIRVALISVTELSKSDLFIIDEGFGSLDETNVEACNVFLESLKKRFKNILVISHVDGIKEIADDILEITKDEHDAYIRYE